MARPCLACGSSIETGWQKGGQKYCSEDCKPRCAVEECDQPRRKRDWCASHYAQWAVSGEVKPFAHKWADRIPCLVCGGDTTGSGRRRFCSNKCERMWASNGGVLPDEVECVGCGDAVSLTVGTRSGRGRRRIDVKLCRKCKTTHSRRWMSPGQLAKRDGATCRLCGGDVDLSLFFPNPMRASNDHVIPRAAGGDPDDPANQQLAHLLCNHIKSDRINPGPIDPTSSVAYRRYVNREVVPNVR